MPKFNKSNGFKMKGFSGFKSSPLKQKESIKDSTGDTQKPRAVKIEKEVPQWQKDRMKAQEQGGKVDAGTVYDPVKKRTNAVLRGNSLARTIKGLGDSIKAIKS